MPLVCKLKTMDASEKIRTGAWPRHWTKFASALLLLMPLAAAAQISLSSAVDLAEKNSTAVRGAMANVQKAAAALAETKDAYIPNFVLGVSPGYSYGFPLGYPSFFNASAQSLVLSWSQRDYMRAAHSALNAANLNLKDTQQQTELDVALAYVQLDSDLKELEALQQQSSYAETLVQLEQDRVSAGVDPRMTELDAELTAAQVDQRRAQLENDADAMRQKLAHLTGLPAAGLTTVSTSIPPAPSGMTGLTPQRSSSDNAGISAAYANAKAKWFTAFGDDKQIYRPLAVFGAQYALFEKTPGYTEYYKNFQYNNVALGVQITFPLFDATRRAKARESSADAAHAQADADAARDLLEEQSAGLRGNLRELAAQQRVAQIQSQIAQEQLRSVETQLNSGTGLPNAPGVPPTQSQKAHIQERQYYTQMLEADLALIKVQLNLMKAAGQIDAWVRSSIQ
ncbi:MAG TPA: TolC family protein [Acidobacteriaceae bacterium]|nr:TolC family protein [Acidobacteriaceae bacterium]